MIKNLGFTVFFILLFIFFSHPVFSSENNSSIIAVSDFSNETGQENLDYLKKGLASSLITSLANYKHLNIVERNQFQAVVKEMGLTNSGFINEKTAATLGKAVGAKQIIVGELVRAGSKFRLNVRLIETESAKILMAITEEGNSTNEIFSLVDNVSYKISKNLLPNITNKTTMEKDKVNIEKSSENSNYYWGSAGAGGYIANQLMPIRPTFQFAYEFSNNLISLNIVDVTGFFSNFGTSEIGVLYGRTFRFDWFFLNVSVGAAYSMISFETSLNPSNPALGSTVAQRIGMSIPMEIGSFFPISDNFGVAIKAKGSVLGPFTYLGLGIEVPIGKLR